MRKTKTMAKSATGNLYTLLERIAQQHLSIETLATRHRAALDPWVAGENAPAGVAGRGGVSAFATAERRPSLSLSDRTGRRPGSRRRHQGRPHSR